MKSAGRRTAQCSLCTEWDGCEEMMGKAGAVIGATLVPEREKKKRRTNREKERGGSSNKKRERAF